jgi:hypothetical protein
MFIMHKSFSIIINMIQASSTKEKFQFQRNHISKRLVQLKKEVIQK